MVSGSKVEANPDIAISNKDNKIFLLVQEDKSYKITEEDNHEEAEPQLVAEMLGAFYNNVQKSKGNKNDVLSMKNVIDLEEKLVSFDCYSIRWSLGFMYANLGLFNDALNLLQPIIASNKIVNDIIAVHWYKKLLTFDTRVIQEPMKINGKLVTSILAMYKCVSEEYDVTLKILNSWTELKLNHSKDDVNNMYYRLNDIQSNQVEDVFQLSERSTNVVVRNGIASGAIESTQNGEYKDPNLISTILRETLQASSYVNELAHSKQAVTITDIKSIHKLLMKTFRYKRVVTQGLIPKITYRMVSSGEFKHANNCITNSIVFLESKYVESAMAIFLSELNIELRKIFEPMKNFASSDIFSIDYWTYHSPYALSALIHHALIQIHPFEDGNGRLTRLISSLPLIMCGLPPICIFSGDKASYYKALRVADNSMDVTELARVFQKHAEYGIRKMNIILEDITRKDDSMFMYDIDSMNTCSI
ncbi:hypothetical protein HDV02_002487 [Globomyces sp. JEL0801]|nr:hypothetical protein HDV02_002487 [Globomyces sp. JEL0801]